MSKKLLFAMAFLCFVTSCVARSEERNIDKEYEKGDIASTDIIIQEFNATFLDRFNAAWLASCSAGTGLKCDTKDSYLVRYVGLKGDRCLIQFRLASDVWQLGKPRYPDRARDIKCVVICYDPSKDDFKNDCIKQ
jgi:hypothetical protein